MEKLKLEIINCTFNSQYKNYMKCNIRNTGYSTVHNSSNFEVQTWYEGRLDRLFFLKKYLEILCKTGYLFVYYIIELDDKGLGEITINDLWHKNLVSYDQLPNHKYVICYEFEDMNEFEKFFYEKFINFINVPNGIWINERPILDINKNQKDHKLEEYYNRVYFKNNYLEVGFDGDFLRLFFGDKKELVTFINELKQDFDLSIEEIKFNCCVE